MALEMKTECGQCHAPLAPEDEAYICSYECTYCEECARKLPKCPNCGGELVRRPRRRVSTGIEPRT